MLTIPCINRETGKVEDLVIVPQEKIREFEHLEAENKRLWIEIRETRETLVETFRELNTLINRLEALEIPF